MDRLRPREKKPFSGFTKAEIEKMEKLHKEAREQSMDQEFYKKLARCFNNSTGRAGKPSVKWMEIQSWFRNQRQDLPSKDTSSANPPEKLAVVPEAFPSCKGNEKSRMPKGTSVDVFWRTDLHHASFDKFVSEAGEQVPDLSGLEFEARSSTDGAWYDVDTFLIHRFLSSGETEVLVRYAGFGAEEDEWVNVKKAVRERSLPLEHSECQKVKVGDLVLCFQENRDQARHYDAHVIEIQRRLHDIRGCRCLFLVRFDHDNSKERVHLKRLCCRPTYIQDL